MSYSSEPSKDFIPEKNINSNSIPVKTLLNLSQKRICKIKLEEGNKTGTGFFLNIMMDKWNYSLKVLITNIHVLNEDDLKPGKKINFSMNNDEEIYEIEIDKERKIYTSQKYDISIIEIRVGDKVGADSFFEIDDNIFNPVYNFKNKTIYLLHYPKGKEMYFSQGSIKKVGEGYEIQHLCDSDYGSSGGPLINSIDYKVIGIHKGASEEFKFNYGTLLREPIIEFKKQIKNKENKIKDNDEIKKKDVTKNEKKEKEKSNLNDKNNEDNKDEITIRYKIEDINYSKEIRIFGDDFVKNNKNLYVILLLIIMNLI